MTFGAHYEHRPTEAFPVMQRTGIKFFRKVTQGGGGIFAGIGQRGYFIRDIFRAFSEPATWGRETLGQMRNIGVDSVPLVMIVAGFLGAVTAFQAFYQLFAGVQLSVLGLLLRGSIVLELGPLLTALVLTGRIGARMTAEIGTMRVTEQIDALETLAYNPMSYLVVPRVLAGLLMFPIVVAFANAVGIIGGWITAINLLDMSSAEFVRGLRIFFLPYDVRFSLIKSASFGLAVTSIGCFFGFTTKGGAEAVGRSTTQAVVVSSMLILVLDAFWAVALL